MQKFSAYTHIYTPWLLSPRRLVCKKHIVCIQHTTKQNTHNCYTTTTATAHTNNKRTGQVRDRKAANKTNQRHYGLENKHRRKMQRGGGKKKEKAAKKRKEMARINI